MQGKRSIVAQFIKKEKGKKQMYSKNNPSQ